MAETTEHHTMRDTPKLLLRIEYNRAMLWFSLVVCLILAFLGLWGIAWAAEPDYFTITPFDWQPRRFTRTMIWIFRTMPEPLRILIMVSFASLFGACTIAVARLLWRKVPLAELRSDGIVSHHLFKRRFDLWHKIRLINYTPRHDKVGKVSHSFRITLPQYGFRWWDHHTIDLTPYKTRFDAEQVRAVLHNKRPDLLPDLFIAQDRPAPQPVLPPVKQSKPVAPGVEVKSNSWTG